jgi:hypothetical protein
MFTIVIIQGDYQYYRTVPDSCLLPLVYGPSHRPLTSTRLAAFFRAGLLGFSLYYLSKSIIEINKYPDSVKHLHPVLRFE